ncbi:MAG: PAS domain S-box protein [Bacteroidetes bacterium]|nr:PAS domain S-box protein [Bacteroidota bacterium]
MRYLRRFFFIPILLIIFLLLILAIYKEVRNKTIAQFNSEQIMIAKAASRGILDYMDDCKSELTFLSRFTGIIDFDEQGKELLKKYYENSAEQIEAITRTDSNGIIIATYPENNEVIGKNISDQRHIHEIIESQKPVISDVFMSVQGYLAIAIHIPVFKDNLFNGSLAVLIAIDKIGKRYLENIKRGEFGYALLLSENNIEIYCPYYEHIGTSIVDVSNNDPTVIKLIEEIKKENFGYLNCIHDKSETFDNSEKHVVFYRIPLGNTYWTILISIPKTEVYKTIAGFQNRLILLFSVLIIIILVYFYFFTKARTVLKEATKRKTAEKALLKSEEKYRLISGVTSDYMFTSILNDEGKIQLNWVAGAFENITGYSLDEYIALGGWRKTLHPDDLGKDDLDMEKLHKNQKVITEVRTYHKNGTLLWVRVYANPTWNDKEDKLIGIYGAVQDITERKNAEEKIKKINQELDQRVRVRTSELLNSQKALLNLVEDLNEKSVELEKNSKLLGAKNKELETFTYSVSHDLKAPLRGIDGYSQILLKEYESKLDAEGKRFLRTIRESAMQMNQLINDLLEYSRLERQTLRPSKVNIKNLIETLVLNKTSEKIFNNFKITTTIPEIEIYTDKAGLNLALRNLIENAFKFTQKQINPKIEIGYQDHDSTHTIFVKDNGIGFNMKFHDRIFEIFQRLHRSEDYEGTGVGLAMVRKAIERLNGKVWAESEVGKGSTFYIEIPKIESNGNNKL